MPLRNYKLHLEKENAEEVMQVVKSRMTKVILPNDRFGNNILPGVLFPKDNRYLKLKFSINSSYSYEKRNCGI